MRWLAKICLLVLAPVALAQTNAQNAPSDPTSVASELKALREAMAQQQQQIAQQQQQIDSLQKALEAKTAGTPHVEDATLRTNSSEIHAFIIGRQSLIWSSNLTILLLFVKYSHPSL